MRIFILFLLILSLLSFSADASSKKEMSLSEVFELLMDSVSREVVISDVVIKIDTTTDRRYFSESMTYGIDTEFIHDLSQAKNQLKINKDYIFFKNVQVDSDIFSIILFHKIDLNSNIYFKSCSLLGP